MEQERMENRETWHGEEKGGNEEGTDIRLGEKYDKKMKTKMRNWEGKDIEKERMTGGDEYAGGGRGGGKKTWTRIIKKVRRIWRESNERIRIYM